MTRAAAAAGLAIVTLGSLALLAGSGSAPATAHITGGGAATKPKDVPPARYVSPRGSDGNAGTIARPWRTIGKAMDALAPGQTAYLRAGEYAEGASGACNSSYNALTWTRSGSAGKPITLAAYPPERGRAIVRTQLKLEGDHLRLAGLVFDRNHAISVEERCNGGVSIIVRGDNVDLVGLEVRNSNMSGVYLREADRLTITRCWIHDNGAHAGQDHGVYVSASTNLLIANTIIDHNAGYGVHIYPDTSDGARIVQNTVVRNASSGLIISGDSERNVIANNIFAYNGEWGARSHHDLNGSANLLLRNLFYSNPEGDIWFPDGGVTTSASVTGSPAFVNLAKGDLRLGPRSAALDKAEPEFSRPFDFRGRKRPQGRAADLGAFER
jgi:parallel beta helix pectate lyase-like protein